MQILLHIGTWKTGSSAIQLFLARNAAQLKTQGVFLPSIVQEDLGHTRLFQTLCHDGADDGPLLKELSAIGAAHPEARVILSSEHFWLLSAEELQKLAAKLRGVTTDIRILAYLRPQDEMWASIYAQEAKRFRVRPSSPVWGDVDFVPRAIMDWALDYHKCLSMFEEAFGAGSATPRLYRREVFPERDIIFDFLDFAGIERDPDFDRYEGDTNPSFGWKSVAMSLWFVDAAYDAMREKNDMPAIRLAFRAAIGDMHNRSEDGAWLGRAPNVLSAADRRDIRAHYAADNLALFQRHFGGEDVFGPPDEAPRDVLDHAAIPEAEFDRARQRMLRHFQKAGLDMNGSEAAFEDAAPSFLTGVRALFTGNS